MKSKTSMKVILLMAFLAILTGCSSESASKSDGWIIGKWALDEEYTKEKLPEEYRKSGDFGKGMAAKMLLTQMNGMTIEFTGSQSRVQLGNGSGEVKDYEIFEVVDSNTVVVKTEDGKIQTYTKTGDYISLATTGGAVFQIYFKNMASGNIESESISKLDAKSSDYQESKSFSKVDDTKLLGMWGYPEDYYEFRIKSVLIYNSSSSDYIEVGTWQMSADGKITISALVNGEPFKASGIFDGKTLNLSSNGEKRSLPKL